MKIKVFLMAMLTIAFLMPAYSQLSDLDLLEDDDRSFGLSINRTPDPVTGKTTETQSAILLVPVSLEDLYFQGGAGIYWIRNLGGEEISSDLQWRVQGGPHYKKVGVQFYIEGFYKEGIDYAGFARFGHFDVWHLDVSFGLGTLVRSDTETTLETGIERTDSDESDTKVKGLALASVEVDTELFDSLRLLGTVLPGFDGEHDYFGELSASYRLDRINFTGFSRIGVERGEFTKQYTLIAQVPF